MRVSVLSFSKTGFLKKSWMALLLSLSSSDSRNIGSGRRSLDLHLLISIAFLSYNTCRKWAGELPV